MSAQASSVADPTTITYTIREFCAAERCSVSMLYKMWLRGRGPRFYTIGAHRRITHQARLEWQRQAEAATLESIK